MLITGEELQAKIRNKMFNWKEKRDYALTDTERQICNEIYVIFRDLYIECFGDIIYRAKQLKSDV